MTEGARFDVSVVMPFGDDEEAVGLAVRRTAEYLRALGVSFELLAVDEDSGDNSHAVLALLRADVPELRVTHAPARGRGVDAGTARAQGTLLFIITPDVAAGSLDGAGDAIRRILEPASPTSPSLDAEVALGRFTVAHRVRALAAFRGARAIGAAMHRRLSKRLLVRRLAIQVTGGGTTAKSSMGRLRAFARI